MSLSALTGGTFNATIPHTMAIGSGNPGKQNIRLSFDVDTPVHYGTSDGFYENAVSSASLEVVNFAYIASNMSGNLNYRSSDGGMTLTLLSLTVITPGVQSFVGAYASFRPKSPLNLNDNIFDNFSSYDFEYLELSSYVPHQSNSDPRYINQLEGNANLNGAFAVRDGSINYDLTEQSSIVQLLSGVNTYKFIEFPSTPINPDDPFQLIGIIQRPETAGFLKGYFELDLNSCNTNLAELDFLRGIMGFKYDEDTNVLRFTEGLSFGGSSINNLLVDIEDDVMTIYYLPYYLVSVPEPSTYALVFGFSALAFAVYRRKKR